MRTLSISAPTHGRVLIQDPAGSASGVLVGCHGYGQNAAIMLEEMKRIPGAGQWRLVSVQALHRFYTRNDQGVVASWMTREDREQAIADNIEYMNRVVVEVGGRGLSPGEPGDRLVYLGFSQGASMAARAAVCGSARASGLIMLGGDIPPDARTQESAFWPPVLIGCGDRDDWYGARVESDRKFLESRNIPHTIVRFDGGHEFTPAFRDAAAEWMSSLPSR